MSAIVSKHEPRNGLRALIDELYARRGGGGGGKGGTQYAFVYRPGDPAPIENVYATWPTLYAAMQQVQGPKLLQIDDSLVSPAVVPAGTYDMSGVTITAVANTSTFTGGAQLSLADGVHWTLDSGGTIAFDAALWLTCSPTSAVIAVPAGKEYNILLHEGAWVQVLGGTAPFVSVSATGFLAFFMHALCGFGDDTHVVVAAGAGPNNCVVHAIESTVGNNATTGAGATVFFDDVAFINGPQGVGVTMTPQQKGVPVSVVQFGAKGDGVTDDFTPIQRAISVLTAAGIPCAFTGPNTYVCSLPLIIPSDCVIVGEPAAEVKSTIAGAGFTNALFYAEATNFGTVASTTLSVAGAPRGGRTLHVASSAGFFAGQSIIVEQAATAGLVAQQFSVLGTGAGTITVDDPVEFTFSSGDTVQTFNPPTNIQIQGNGMSVIGSGGALFEIQSGQRVIVADVNVPSTTVTSYVGSLDTASRDCQWVRCRGNGGGVAPAVWSIESGNRCKAIDCTAQGGNLGFWNAGGARNEYRGCAAWDNATTGIALVPTTAADVDGAQKTKLVDCDCEDNGTYGAYQQLGSDTEIVNFRGDFNVQGLFLQGVTRALLRNIGGTSNSGNTLVLEANGGTACTSIVASGVSAVGDGNAGILVDAGSHTAELSDLSLTDTVTGLSVAGTAQLSLSNVSTDRCSAAGIGISAAATLLIANHRALNCGLAGGKCITTTAASDVTILGGRYRLTTAFAGNWFGVDSIAAGALWQINDLVLEKAGAAGGTMFAIVDNAGGGATMRLRDVRTVGALDYGIYIAAAAGTILRIGEGNNFSSCGTPTTYGAAQRSKGTVVANGVTAVPVAFTDIQTSDIDTVKLTSTGATPTAYLFSQTPGTGFSIKATAGDTNTYDYEIS